MDMKQVILAVVLLAGFIGYTHAHGGRTDSSGGHNCSEKSKQKGLCTGYHYHSNGRVHEDGSDRVIELSELQHGVIVRSQSGAIHLDHNAQDAVELREAVKLST